MKNQTVECGNRHEIQSRRLPCLTATSGVAGGWHPEGHKLDRVSGQLHRTLSRKDKEIGAMNHASSESQFDCVKNLALEQAVVNKKVEQEFLFRLVCNAKANEKLLDIAQSFSDLDFLLCGAAPRR